MSPANLETAPDRRAAVDRARAGWIKRLIDLSRRNNLIYFRELKNGTLDLSAADRDVLDELVAGKSVTLSQLLPGADPVKTAAVAREIGRKAQSNLEEKGLQTLFLALGMASWQPDDDGRAPESAVLLIPVTMESRGLGRNLTLRRSGDIQFNLVLAHVLTTLFGVKLDTQWLLDLAEVEEGETTRFLPEGVFDALGRAAARVPGFTVGWRLVLGNFSFQKMAMVKDLQDRAEELAGHDLITAMAGSAEAARSLSARPFDLEPGELDRHQPETEYYVLDADSSQQRVAEIVFAGQSAVIQGPPGTGKSQTIANLIAGLAARGRRVLFVAEKRAALEVVQRRLEREGLGHLALDLHGADLTRQQVMQRIRTGLAQVSDSLPVPPDDVHRRFTDQRRRLLEHVQRMHVQREPSGLSVYEMQGRLLRLPAEAVTPLRWRTPQLDHLTTAAAEKVETALRELAGHDSLVLETDPSPWTGARIADGAAAQAASDLALRVSDLFRRVQDEIDTICRTGWLRRPPNLAEAEALLALADGVAQTAARFQDALWDQDLNALTVALAPAAKGGFSHVMNVVVSSGYRAALKQAHSLAKPGAPEGSAADMYALITTAADQLRRWRIHAEGSVRPVALPDAAATYGRVKQLIGGMEALAQVVRLGDWKTMALSDLGLKLQALADDRNTPTFVAAISLQEAQIRALGAGAIMEEIRRAKPTAGLWHLRFRYAYLASHLDKVWLDDPGLAGFKGRTHDEAAAEFRRLDRQRIKLAAERVRRQHAEHVVEVMNENPDQAALVGREAEKKSRHLPLRKLLATAPDVLTALFPCWMASPLSVSQLMDADRRYFDVVLFDEASQVLPEDAVPSIMRGTQLVVAGDEHQLPPTIFFADGAEEEEDPDEDESAAVGFESLLKLSAAFLPRRMLQWHYRSEDESLIAFSNRHIYESGLVTFPGTGGPLAVSHVLVEQEPGREGQEESSAREVAKVVELILAHAQQHPERSLGVIAMGIKHAHRVQAALDAALQQRRDLDSFFDQTRQERFFIKNLERVQGDERDVIILTVGYGKDRSGKLPYRFGPLLQDGGERRLNVAVTRARKQMTLVSSFTHLDMDPERSKARGVELLRLYLQYASSQGRSSGGAAGTGAALKEFEEDVRTALTAQGISLLPQWGASQYRIDLVAEHPHEKGRYVLAIECDGATYASAPTARDRDRLRQQQLEALGWRFHRIWSTDWYLRRDEEIARAVKAFEEAVVHADQVMAERARAAAAARPEVAQPQAQVAQAPAAGATAAHAAEAAQTATPEAEEPQRQPRPWVAVKEKIDDYLDSELIALIRWIRSDGRLRTDEEIIREMVRELGFARRGARIEERIRQALEQA
jgi:very-short-patch-repair endonuclease